MAVATVAMGKASRLADSSNLSRQLGDLGRIRLKLAAPAVQRSVRRLDDDVLPLRSRGSTGTRCQADSAVWNSSRHWQTLLTDLGDQAVTRLAWDLHCRLPAPSAPARRPGLRWSTGTVDAQTGEVLKH